MIRILQRLGLALLLLTLAVATLDAQQQPITPLAFSQKVEDWRHTLDQVQASLAEGAHSRETLDSLRAKADAVHDAAATARAEADGLSKPLKDQLAALGPAPAKGQTPESPEVARQRKQLVDQLAIFETRVKQAELTLTRASGIARDIARVANEQIAQRLFSRQKPPISLLALSEVSHEFADVISTLATAPIVWWRSGASTNVELVSIAWLGFLVLLGLGIGWPVRSWLLRRYGHVPDTAEPTYARRIFAAGVEGLARGLLPAIGLLALAAVLSSEAIVTGLLARMIAGVLFGIIFFSLSSALARAALAPEAPNWRIVPFGAESSRLLARRLTALAAAAATAFGLRIATRDLQPNAHELFDLVWLVFDTVIAGLTLTLLQHKLWQMDPATADDGGKSATPKPGEPKREEATSGGWSWPIARLVTGLALIAVPFIALAGYVNLADHIVSRVMTTGLLFGAFFLVRTLIREVISLFIAPDSPRSAKVRQLLALSDQGSRILVFWLGAVLDLALILPGIALALRLWGVPGSAVGLLVESVLRGVAVGNLHLSLGEIALSVLVFAIVWTITRLIQRLLREKLLPQTRLDPGVRHSLAAMVGYVGFIIALAFAVSTVGLNLSNLAIIAGALSVGIGFGLQNIVNNFVSGLILLIERPIKVGDWVVVGQHQGFITRISVRATEIETFERASVIVPNSELLSGAVVNWTHRDKYGRVDIKVGVAYGTDTDKVREILLACARQHRQILAWPQPYVLFKSFGDSSLDFELRCFVTNIEQHMHVKSDLHFEIDKSFRAANIEIPFAQRDLNIRNVDKVAAAIATAVSRASPPEDRSRTDARETPPREGIRPASGIREV